MIAGFTTNCTPQLCSCPMSLVLLDCRWQTVSAWWYCRAHSTPSLPGVSHRQKNHLQQIFLQPRYLLPAVAVTWC